MEKYHRGKIYAIICRKTGRRYIGSTCEPTLARRLAQHVVDFKNWKKEKRSWCSSFDIIKDGDYYIVLIESYSCNSKDELRMCEQKHIGLNEAVNKIKAFRIDEERLEYQKQYIKQNCDKIAEQRKQHYEQNRDELIEKNKQYREQNRNEINAKGRERVCCPTCHKEMSRNWVKRHKNTCPQLKKDIVTDVI